MNTTRNMPVSYLVEKIGKLESLVGSLTRHTEDGIVDSGHWLLDEIKLNAQAVLDEIAIWRLGREGS